LVGRERIVGAEVGEVEHGGAEARIFVVDQPQAPAVVDDVGGQQVVMAESDGKRQLGGFELGVDGEPTVEVAARAVVAQLAHVVAVHVEDPEHEAGTGNVSRHVVVKPPEETRDARHI